MRPDRTGLTNAISRDTVDLGSHPHPAASSGKSNYKRITIMEDIRLEPLQAPAAMPALHKCQTMTATPFEWKEDDSAETTEKIEEAVTV